MYHPAFPVQLEDQLVLIWILLILLDSLILLFACFWQTHNNKHTKKYTAHCQLTQQHSNTPKTNTTQQHIISKYRNTADEPQPPTHSSIHLHPAVFTCVHLFTTACVLLCISQCWSLQVILQQVQLLSLQCLAVDAILPLLVDPADVDTLMNHRHRYTDVWSGVSRLDVPHRYANTFWSLQARLWHPVTLQRHK